MGGYSRYDEFHSEGINNFNKRIPHEESSGKAATCTMYELNCEKWCQITYKRKILCQRAYETYPHAHAPIKNEVKIDETV